MHTHQHRLKATEALATYARAKMPTTALLLLLADAIATMLAADTSASVTLLIDGIAITRAPVNAVRHQ
jgi:hypothetical protein